ncbi:cyclase family protein [Nocardia macrotermitis]|uniref:Kynurenine formamidase n=1 Tax=Nocardia macrotermitis TaxID=2585198 RepID=A0A7K0D922_9NOCA|nr:cyclase family protein [Nocardia macrotermitis]MQY22208.1 Kynurenine formamidase [Nocardia macrotermitis]
MGSVHNLSHPLSTTTISVFPGDPPPRLDTVCTLSEDGYYLRTVTVGEHTGTHWGAPAHFTAGAAAAHELLPEDFVLPGVTLDIADRAALDHDYAVTVTDLLTWQDRHGPFPPEAAVLLHTGWDARWGTDDFANHGPDGHMHHPGFSTDAVHWLLEHGVLAHRGALGTDTFSPDIGADDTFAVSKLLYREHRLSLEILTALGDLPPRDFTVVVGGFVSEHGSGSPASIYALVPDPERGDRSY